MMFIAGLNVGIIAGILLSLITIIITLYFRPSIERKVNQLASQFKEKGRIIEPENDMETFLESLKQENE